MHCMESNTVIANRAVALVTQHITNQIVKWKMTFSLLNTSVILHTDIRMMEKCHFTESIFRKYYIVLLELRKNVLSAI